ncbi:MAG TPA: HIT domain-containing protein [Myxococcota bacterium]|nr:HIT domain-containing protein [Myxococcota bacterium]HRY96128.1 HIT domain-containing protein [Myxococcota bacterium]
MNRIWAPWRMEYILAPKEGGCIFCFEPAQDPERWVLRREPEGMVLLNKYPYTGGHVMVVPRAHVSRPHELSAAQFSALNALLHRSIQALEERLRPDGMNVGMNLGRVAGAGVADHLHWHVVPRWNGDNNFMPVLGDVRVMNEYLDRTCEHLKPAFAW